MYWGAVSLRLAVSADLLHWQRVRDAAGQDVSVLTARSEQYRLYYGTADSKIAAAYC